MSAPARTIDLPSAPSRGALWILLVGNALVFIGTGFFSPILPLFIKARGGSPELVGLIFGAGVLAMGLMQYPAGWLADRYGRRPILVGSMAAYSLLFLLYLLPLPTVLLLPLRFVHGAFAGAFNPAAAALTADLTDESERGTAFGKLRASTMVGFLLGPALGGIMADFRLDFVFLAAAVVCGLATVLLLALPAPLAREQAGPAPPRLEGRLVLAMLPVLVMGGAVGYFSGVYGSTWALYLTHRGANPFQIGLSYTAVAIPIVLLSGPAGRLADTIGAREVGAFSVLLAGVFAIIYGFIDQVWLLIGLGLIEGVGIVGASPSLQGAASRLAGASAQGRAQGIYASGLLAFQLAGAVISGFLFAIDPRYPLFSIGVVCVALAVGGWFLWRVGTRIHLAPGSTSSPLQPLR